MTNKKEQKHPKETEKQSKESKHQFKKEEAKKDPKDAQIEELTDSLQRLQAEFENHKKYVEKEKQDFMKFAKAQFIDTLLPTIDTFEAALKQTENAEKFVEGIKMLHNQLMSMLKREGLKEIEVIGKEFDPHFHEVMMKKQSEEKEETIVQELQKGYMFKDKVLRHSKVIISEGNNSEETEKSEK